MTDFVHIVCLDAPAPPNYGGAIDMFYKIRALAQAGKKIKLHYFQYKENRNATALQPFCAAIYAYKRKTALQSLSFSEPYIVTSRINKKLIERLNRDDYPVILEGLHCGGILPYLKPSRRVLLRMHNNEPDYYRNLAAIEKNIFKKFYFLSESKLLERYQLQLPKSTTIISLSLPDQEQFKATYGLKNAHFVPCFIPWQQVMGLPGRGKYCLYHGNMAVAENAAAAAWLVQEVFSGLQIPLLIAGSNIPAHLKAICLEHANIKIINEPSIAALDQLIIDAQINVLPSVNTTGVKLKILHAAFAGRFCITNTNGAGECGITGVHVADDATTWINLVKELFNRSFAEADVLNRKPMEVTYNNKFNAKKLSALW